MRGPVSAGELGATDAHDHLLGAPASREEPDLVLDDEAAALGELRRFRAAGGGALVECSTIDYGRQPDGLRRLSETSGVHIIAVTGFNRAAHCAPLLAGRTVSQVAELVLRDFRAGGMDGTGVLPGAVKAATGLDGMSPEEEVALRAAARVHRQTGVPVLTHTEAGTFALQQLDLLQAEGVPPARVIVCHLDRRLDFDYLSAVANRGAFVSFDQVGKGQYGADADRAAMLARLAAAGHGAQLLVGGDYARRSYWPVFGGRLGPAYLLTGFVPLLRGAGLDGAAVRAILVENPARALAAG